MVAPTSSPSSLSGGNDHASDTTARRRHVQDDNDDDGVAVVIVNDDSKKDDDDNEKYDDIELPTGIGDDGSDNDDGNRKVETKDGIMRDDDAAAATGESTRLCFGFRKVELFAFIFISTILVTLFCIGMSSNNDGRLINNDKNNGRSSSNDYLGDDLFLNEDEYNLDCDEHDGSTMETPSSDYEEDEEHMFLPPNREERDKVKDEIQQALSLQLKEKTHPFDEDFQTLEEYILNWSPPSPSPLPSSTTGTGASPDGRYSSYGRALQWIIYEDPRALQPDDPSLLHRYALVLIYFVTTRNGKVPWLSCNPPFNSPDMLHDDEGNDYCTRKKLISTNPLRYNTVPAHRWLSGRSFCQWSGVACTQQGDQSHDYSQVGSPDHPQRVSSLFLSFQNITSTVPLEVKYLSDTITGLSLSYNFLSGTLPELYATYLGSRLTMLQLNNNPTLFGSIPSSWWTGFPNLGYFGVKNNGLTGSVPFDRIGMSMKELSGLYLENNEFTGIINTQLGLLTNLAKLKLDGNHFGGTIPTEIGNLSNCGFLSLQGLTNIQGRLPSEIGRLSTLIGLYLSGSSLTGPIPSEVGITHLGYLKLSAVTFTGSLPSEIWSLTKLQEFDLSDMPFAAPDATSSARFVGGIIPTSVAMIPDLRDLRLRNAGMVGTIPKELGLLTNLNTVWLHGNGFEGNIPDEVCALRGPVGLGELSADCAISPMNPDDATVSCPADCCTACCSGEDPTTCDGPD